MGFWVGFALPSSLPHRFQHVIGWLKGIVEDVAVAKSGVANIISPTRSPTLKTQ